MPTEITITQIASGTDVISTIQDPLVIFQLYILSGLIVVGTAILIYRFLKY